MENIIKGFYQNEQGGGAVEYALILSLVAIAVVTTLTALGAKIGNTFTNVTSHLH
jgi:pilus assembly protein Flp/PilA